MQNAFLRCFVVVAVSAAITSGMATQKDKGLRADEAALAPDKLPKAVVDALKSKFPKSELLRATQEDDDGEIEYEVTVKDGGQQIDVTLTATGKIEAIEKELAVGDLPKAVTAALEKKYPKATYQKIDAVFEIEDGKEELEFYEIEVVTAGKQELELKIGADGRIKTDGEKREKEDQWTSNFLSEKEHLVSTGRNPYFILEPGYQMVLEGGKERLTITVLAETKQVDGVETRVVEERESKDGKLVEVSRNFFAISKRTNNVYYFGEEVDLYKDGKISGHEGAWLSGVKGARFGLAMPGLPLIGAKYQQEVAPGVAMDRGEIVGVDEPVAVPAGEFKHCLKVKETTALDPDEQEFKQYAPGVGLLVDGGVKLVRYGKVESAKK